VLFMRRLLAIVVLLACCEPAKPPPASGGILPETPPSAPAVTLPALPSAPVAARALASPDAPSASAGAPPDAPRPASSASIADRTLRGIDWCNRSYGQEPSHPTLTKCQGSVAQRHSAGGGIWGFHAYKLVSVTYGDLTGDGDEDALLVLETSLQPVLIGPTPPARSWEMWLIQRRGQDLYEYTSESSPQEPLRVTIAHGTATFVLRDGARQCEERWRFGAEGLTATRSPRACRPILP
jgi:hypothetical protein